MFSKCLFAAVLSALLLIGTALAGDSPKGNVHPYIHLSASERLRLVSWDNSITLNNDADGGNTFTRHRTKAMVRVFPHEKVEFGLELTNEFRYYFKPDSIDFEINEIFFDQLYLKGMVGPVTATVGRQNLIFGEGFVMLDGSPLDGSRSAYFNAARLDVKPCPQGTISIFYSFQPYQEDYLPLINDQDKALIEMDEQAYGIYLDRDLEKGNIQAYYLRKNRKNPTASTYGYEINTFGARLHTPLSSRLSFTGELATQSGEWNYRYDHSAFGFYTDIDYNTGWKQQFPKTLTAGLVYLTGDDPGTDRNEGWEPVFGRWPKWSESYIYTLLNEGNGIAYWSDYFSIYGRAEFRFTEKIGFRAEYQSLHADQRPDREYFEGRAGRNRGDLLMGKLTYKHNQYLSGHVVWEHFMPGNFYIQDADAANWFRIELMLKVE